MPTKKSSKPQNQPPADLGFDTEFAVAMDLNIDDPGGWDTFELFSDAEEYAKKIIEEKDNVKDVFILRTECVAKFERNVSQVYLNKARTKA